MRKSLLPAWAGALLLAAALVSAAGCESKGTAGANGTSCSATKTGTTTTISCTDGTSVNIEDGAKGDPGAKGDAGLKGDTGATGAKGDTGAQGAKGDTGATGANSTPCAVVDNGDGTKTVTCGTTSVKLSDGATGTAGVDGKDGKDGQPCQVADNGNGTKTITCDGVTVDLPVGNTGDKGDQGPQGEPGANGTDGTNGTDGAPGKDGVNGKDAIPCTVVDIGGGNKKITCGDGSSVTVSNGQAAASFIVKNFHGIDYLMTTGEYLGGAKSLVTAKITGASVDPDSGKVTVTFTLVDSANKAVTGVKSAGIAIARLAPPANGEGFSQWVPYLYTKAVAGVGVWNGAPYNTDAAFTTFQATRESSNADPTKGGTLTESATVPGTYTYVSLVNLKTAKKDTTAVGFNASQTHRVAVMIGGHAGPTADATWDFVPNGDPVSFTRDIVQTDTCKQCHGPLFKAHGGDRLHVETCVLCHNPSTIDPQSGNTIDLKVMVHKIHAGQELQSTPGPDGIVFDNPATVANEAADNSNYTIFGYNNSVNTWWDVGYPAVITNCTKCHQGTGAQVDNWKNIPSTEACGSCHDKIDFTKDYDPAAAFSHKGGAQADGTCGTCHKATGLGLAQPVAGAHDWTVKDPRNISEFNITMTVSLPDGTQPATGYYKAGDKPIIRIAVKDMLTGNPVDTSTVLQDDTTNDEGCLITGCPASDGKLSGASLFVHGPRAENKPVLSYNARAVIVAGAAGPWNLTSAKTLAVTFDGGKDVWGKDVTGGDFVKSAAVTVTLPTSGALKPASIAAVTATELMNILNADAKFTLRGIAFMDELTGRLAIRSRNLGETFSIQLPAATTTTDLTKVENVVFGADASVHTIGPYLIYTPAYIAAGGSVGLSTVANKLFSTVIASTAKAPTFIDPKATFTKDYIQYQLDAVDDLQPGTYIANVEFKDRGSVSGNSANYKTPSVARVTFQVGTATEEKPIAGNCNSCHQGPDQTLLPNGNPSPDGKKGFVFDFSGHHKLFDFNATDMCTACHDWEGQSATGDWSGAKPIARRVHSLHNGANLNYPNYTVGHADGDPGRNWNIAYPQDIRNCQQCHVDGTTSGTWATKPGRIPCLACHDSDAATAHGKIMTYDLTPLNPYSGDETEACATCHAP